jgi:hypothetical protein
VTPLTWAFVAAALTVPPAAAQTGRSQGEAAPKTMEPSSMPLSSDKHWLVKEHVRRAKVPEVKIDEQVAVGMTVPEGVELWGLPQDSMTEVPTVSSYKFFHVGKVIAVVDPDSRKVVQLIRN